MSNKEKIRSNFNKAARTYDQYCHVQNKICLQAITLLLKQQIFFDCIADFACGTGESTSKLLRYIHHKKCYAIDFAEKLLTVAKTKLSNKNIDFVCEDLEKPIFKTPCLDLLFCNMGLQWVDNLNIPIQLFYNYLNPNGLLVFSMPINQNFPEITSAFKLSPPSNNSIIQTLKHEKFNLISSDIKTISVSFENQYDLLKSLKCLGANYCQLSERHRRQGLHKIKTNKIFNNPTNTKLTYIIGIYLARKSNR